MNECATLYLSDSLRLMDASGLPHDFVRAITAGHRVGDPVFGRPLTVGAMCVSMARWRRRGSSARTGGKGAESWRGHKYKGR